MRYTVIGLGLIFLVLLAWGGYVFYRYMNPPQQNAVTSRPTIVNPDQAEEELSQAPEEIDYFIEPYVQNLYVPWELEFTSPDRMLVTERDGKVRLIENGELRNEPLISFDEVSTQAEEGLMGLALDPDYETNAYVYVCLAYPKNNQLVDKIVRLIDEGDRLVEDTTILDDIPAARFHAGCRIAFGPDDTLFITTGDATEKEIAQDLDSLGGKILRINPDGSIPDDNPFEGSPVYSFGHRNPQGIDWYPGTDIMYSTEHGPSTFDGPPGGDEVNIIRAGQNYGWPVVSHEESREEFVDPALVFTPAEAPASGMFYSSSVLPQFQNNFFFGALRGEGIVRIVVSEENPENVLSFQKLPDVNVGRIRDLEEGPDGFIYFSTSNQDGRGEVRPGDDAIYRIRP